MSPLTVSIIGNRTSSHGVLTNTDVRLAAIAPDSSPPRLKARATSAWLKVDLYLAPSKYLVVNVVPFAAALLWRSRRYQCYLGLWRVKAPFGKPVATSSTERTKA